MKRMCDDPIYQHLTQAIENDRAKLALQFSNGTINPRVQQRYERNRAKLEKYEDQFLQKQI